METNADITIYNQHLNSELKDLEYLPTKIKGVHWYADLKMNLDKTGIHNAEVYKIRIPKEADTDGRKYIDPNEYRHLSQEMVAQYWTIQKGDLFTKGATDMTIEELKNTNDFGKVFSIGDNRRGLEPHFRIGGA